MLVLGPSCRAEETSSEAKPVTEVAKQAMPIQVKARPKKVQIHVQRKQENIFTTPHNISVCEDPVFCDGDAFEWVIAGGLNEGEVLTIKDAPGFPSCFSDTIPVEIKVPNNGADSGPPDDSCRHEKYGTFWPYIIEMELADGTKFSTDPGGIIHP
jgi:hypothetical protein